jgi:hypothetical protein
MIDKKNIDWTPFVHTAIIIASIILLSYVDFIVLEKIHHPIAKKDCVSWGDFNAVFLQKELPIIWWHFAFIPMGVCLFILLGIAARSFRLFFAGLLMFAAGWEDIVYYVMQGKWLPEQLSWLDYSPLMTLTRFITSTEHVTRTGVLISSLAALIVSPFILFSINPFSCFKKIKAKSS